MASSDRTVKSKSGKSAENNPSTGNTVASISAGVTRSNQLPQHGGENPRIRLIPIQVVQEILGVGRTFVIEHSANNQMPRPVKFGTSRRAAVRWFEHEILDYVMTLAAQRDQQASNNQVISPDGVFDRSEGQDM